MYLQAKKKNDKGHEEIDAELGPAGEKLREDLRRTLGIVDGPEKREREQQTRDWEVEAAGWATTKIPKKPAYEREGSDNKGEGMPSNMEESEQPEKAKRSSQEHEHDVEELEEKAHTIIRRAIKKTERLLEAARTKQEEVKKT